MGNSDDFFDDFPEGIEVDWSKISDTDLDLLIATLSRQDVEKIFGELQNVIDTNNKRKSIVDVALKILQVAVSLGMKIV